MNVGAYIDADLTDFQHLTVSLPPSRTTECQEQYAEPCVLIPTRHHTYSWGHVDGHKKIRINSSEKTYNYILYQDHTVADTHHRQIK